MACRSLKPIGKDSCKSNKGGLFTTVWAINRTKLTFTPEYLPNSSSDEDKMTGYVILGLNTSASATAADFVTYKFRKQSSGLTSEGTFDDANGVSFFTNNLALVFARQDNSKRIAIQALALQEDLALIVRDANGEMYFLGFDDSVTTTAAGAATGTAATDANQYTITLTDISSELPFFVRDEDMKTMLGDNYLNV